MRRPTSLSRRAFCACLACGLAAPRAMASDPSVPPAVGAVEVKGTLEPHLNVAKSENHATPHVALTLDACSGHVDMRILSVLMDEEIPATIFVTARWLRKNAEALALLKSRPDLFELENHGLNHVPAIDRPGTVYGIPTAGSMEAVVSEVENGAKWMVKDGLAAPRWFRGATARYTPASITAIEGLGYRIAGFSLNGDQGASLPAGAVAKRIAAARDGDVIISHVNHPERDSGAGVAKGVLALKARGAVFVRLDTLEGREVAGMVRQ
ncbi:polysaccharide deacetylase family protein [Rhizobium sp. S95]|uniref:Chitooligosaccharide deacetylase n=1 Tax=Ciceribacter sichuanensis TaxID=2949647 RepID=A0AAJ1BSU5_9HYPH|nr:MULTISPECIES: polysaccharide deacetylase family protein [unclassified Ciceribacter]MCM2395152.1 polysaccharide deacetylase family protein [Ciceribacter sp. S95]MCO5955574.1 polysaccharide deacetylase family protein [Ciceribacter sp. S101]